MKKIPQIGRFYCNERFDTLIIPVMLNNELKIIGAISFNAKKNKDNNDRLVLNDPNGSTIAVRPYIFHISEFNEKFKQELEIAVPAEVCGDNGIRYRFPISESTMRIAQSTDKDPSLIKTGFEEIFISWCGHTLYTYAKFE